MFNPSSTNFFERLGLPTDFVLDASMLEEAYFKKQREFHPDRFARKSENERKYALDASMAINEAYATLKSPSKRAQHMLALHRIYVNGEEDTVKPDQATLMEILEWREKLQEAYTHTQIEAVEAHAAIESRACEALLTICFAAQDFQEAARVTIRLHYLTKLLEEARIKHSAISA